MGKQGDAAARTGGPGKGFYAALAVVAVAGIALLVLARGGEDGELNAPLPAWAGQVEPDSTVGIPLGRPDAPVTIAEFADYQCPHCAQFGTFTGRLIRQNYVGGQGIVRWLFYEYLVGFPNSLPAALAARCAGDQGRYWEMHDLLLSRQNRWGTRESPAKLFREYAEELGLDGDAFATCLAERRHLEEVLAAHEYGRQRGVQGTPTLFLNGRRLDTGSETSYEALERLILAAADSARRAESDASGEAGGR